MVVDRPADSQECFRWTVLADLFVSSGITDEINWTGIRQRMNTLRFINVKGGGKRMSLSEIETLKKEMM